MAKSRAPSKRSRAVRRATSPSIDTDKSLKEIQPPRRSDMNLRPSVLAVHQAAGISKKQKPVRKARMSAKARRRHDKGLEMAEAVLERTSRKLEKSVGRARNVQARRKGWEDINKTALAEAENADGNDNGDNASGEWATDEEMDGDDDNDDGGKNTGSAARDLRPDAKDTESAPALPVDGGGGDDDGDEIL